MATRLQIDDNRLFSSRLRLRSSYNLGTSQMNFGVMEGNFCDRPFLSPYGHVHTKFRKSFRGLLFDEKCAVIGIRHILPALR